eukprot:gene21611-25994_t
MTHGRVLVVDEADKAAPEVVCVLKGLLEDGEILLPDGRRFVSERSCLYSMTAGDRPRRDAGLSSTAAAARQLRGGADWLPGASGGGVVAGHARNHVGIIDVINKRAAEVVLPVAVECMFPIVAKHGTHFHLVLLGAQWLGPGADVAHAPPASATNPDNPIISPHGWEEVLGARGEGVPAGLAEGARLIPGGMHRGWSVSGELFKALEGGAAGMRGGMFGDSPDTPPGVIDIYIQSPEVVESQAPPEVKEGRGREHRLWLQRAGMMVAATSLMGEIQL